MDAVTYPHPRVKGELTNWVVVRIDITEQPRVVKLFGVEAIPVAIAVAIVGETGSRELGRIENFVEPAMFAGKLRAWRGDDTP